MPDKHWLGPYTLRTVPFHDRLLPVRERGDPDSPTTVRIHPDPILYAHQHCEDELNRRFESRLCVSCGDAPNGLDGESCPKCGDPFMAVTEERKFVNF